jgi:hypothetical protein
VKRFLLLTLALGAAAAAELPGAYFKLLEAGSAMVEKRLDAMPGADLRAIEAGGGWRHFPYAILAPAVLYAHKHPANPRYGDPKLLALAVRIGDLCAAESEKGTYQQRGDNDWDSYMWLEAWRLLERDLGDARRARWRRELERLIAVHVDDAIMRLDFPWWHSPFIGTSPNHYVQWATLLHLGGRTFANKEWEALGARILRRFAMTEQSPDGFWGEHNRDGPTIGYNHLTLTGVALYWEHSRDPDVMPAIRKATELHRHYTFLDGAPIDVVNDRTRRWGVSAWAQFAFTHWPEGRGYTAFLVDQFRPESLTVDQIGRLAQSALYYHEGPWEAAPQRLPKYRHQMSIAAGVRKTGPWQTAYSGIMNSQAPNSQFYLDRQGHLSVFHEKLGLIVTGANSKRQHELATFYEKLMGFVSHMPISTRLQMDDRGDRLSLGYHTFFSDIYVPEPAGNEVSLRFSLTARGRPPDEGALTLQVCLKAGEALETGAGRTITLGAESFDLGPAELGGWIRHAGWRIQVDPAARLAWPVYPFNPYANAPETSLRYAVARLYVPLAIKPGRYIRPKAQEMEFRIVAE